jgi:hypothetical protein
MKRRHLLLCLWLCACGGDDAHGSGTLDAGADGGPQADGLTGDAEPELQHGELLALTYNVAGLPEELSQSMPLTYTPMISPLLNGYDLVLVQESWLTPEDNPLEPLRVYHELLVADAEHPYRSVPATHPINTDPERPSAIIGDGLNRFSDFPFDAVIRERWVQCVESAADCLALKGFSAARTYLTEAISVDVYNLHMEAGGTPEDDAARDSNIDQLLAFMADYSADRAVIVGGDFNLHTDSEPARSQFDRLLEGGGLRDACYELACEAPGNIDKFLFRSSDGLELGVTAWSFESEVFMTADGQPLSDHEPVAVRFAWRER